MAYRMAYLGEAYVNWCPQLGTVLANDEIKDGVSERGGYPVERKLMKQWSMRITAYAQRLLDGLDTLDWTDSLKEAQRNWIGKSEGTSLKFKVANSTLDIEVFTTRPDTIFGVSFVTLAPEHELVTSLTTPENKEMVEAYITQAKNRSERERQADINKITGVPTGSFVEHPFTGKQIPIWIGDYVLAGYGTGAVMAVPAHDSRDYSFAKHFGLPILEVVAGGDLEKESYDAKEGTLINSDFLNGLDVKAAMKKAIAEIEAKNLGKGKVNFRLRDAVFGRQRYWGEPIPIYYKNDIPYALSDSELPLVLPEVDKYLPTEDGEPPLARAKDWKYQNEFDYEHSTMPGWAGSSWYFLRYMDPHNGLAFADKKLADYWKQVDLYIGGSEHATGHLLYVRFWTKILNDLGHIAIDEPAKKLINQGMIQGRSNFVYRINGANKFVSANLKSNYETTEMHVDVNIVENDILDIEKFRNWREEFKNAEFILDNGKYITHEEIQSTSEASPLERFGGAFLCDSLVEKMSKSKWNVVNPDDIVQKHGADCLRLYEMFLGPLELSKPWNTNGITGVSGFLKKFWRLFTVSGKFEVSNEAATKQELKVLHKTIKKVKEDIERFSFNTSVSTFMICTNELTDLKCNKREILEPLTIILSPYAPHIAEEVWKNLGHETSITFAAFPTCNESYLVESSFEYPISINGKTKFNLELELSLSKEDVEKVVLANEQMIKFLDGKPTKKVIVVPGKIVNVVV
jgi:leucyl-tRNA synthetase